MEFSLNFNNGILEVKTCGEGNTMDFGELLAAVVSHPDWQKGGSAFIDHSEIDLGDLSANDVMDISIICKNYRDILGHGKCALLVPHDVDFGKARMWELIMDGNWDMRVKVSRDRDILFKWLKSG
jgi:hypothetical protein